MIEKLSLLESALSNARAALLAARELSANANRDECVALNAFNKATKAIDEYLKELKANSPRNTDWAER